MRDAASGVCSCVCQRVPAQIHVGYTCFASSQRRRDLWAFASSHRSTETTEWPKSRGSIRFRGRGVSVRSLGLPTIFRAGLPLCSASYAIMPTWAHPGPLSFIRPYRRQQFRANYAPDGSRPLVLHHDATRRRQLIADASGGHAPNLHGPTRPRKGRNHRY